MTVNAAELALIDRWQRHFPLTSRPFMLVGQSAGLSEQAMIETFARLRDGGVISRIGAVVKPHTVGASTLAAMSVPLDRLDEVAARVSADPLVNHNYQREHAFNLWFVVAGPEHGAVRATLERIAGDTQLAVIDLPLRKAYHIDLGFPLTDRSEKKAEESRRHAYDPDENDRAILAGIEDGVPLQPRPYREVADRVGCAENEVIERLRNLVSAGIVTRFGCVVRHRALGYGNNAMAVWDIPDNIVDATGASLAKNSHVTLCYRRDRHLPDWPHNLFCMIHARTRADAISAIGDINTNLDLGRYGHAVLFSTRCFKQRGATFSGRTGTSH